MAHFDFKKLVDWLMAKTKPTRMLALVHPENVPLTMRRTPEDFYDYKYVGPAIERITSQQGMRHPALVARLIRKYLSASGASVEEEMTASLKDLERGHHPRADEIGKALRSYYETKIQNKNQISPRLQTVATREGTDLSILKTSF